MAIILPANTISAGGFSADNSCRFNSADSAYMHKTIASGGNEKTWTCSFWIKLCTPSTDDYVFSYAAGSGSTARGAIDFQAADNSLSVELNPTGSSWTLCKVSNVKFRDPGAFYNIVVACDTTQGTEANRLKVYINGTQYALSAYPALNLDTGFNSAVQHTVGRYENADSGYINAYISEFYWIDGTAYAASDFGEFDEDSPTIWKPKDASGLTFGTNGFYLDFEDSSNLGNDKNGGTDLTEVNLAAADQATDTPTNNYPTWNPLTDFGDGTLSEGNTRFTGDSVEYAHCGTTFAASTGKWYFEMQHAQTQSKVFMFCLHDVNNTMYFINNNIWFATSPNSTGTTSFYLQLQNTNHATNRDISIRKYVDQTQSTVTSTGGNLSAVLPVGILQIYLDLDNGRIHYYNNGTAIDNSNAASSTAGYGDIPAGTYSFSISDARAPDGGDDGPLLLDLNFGSPSANISISSGNTDANGYGNFEYSPTVGGVDYYAMNSKNLAEFG